MKIATKEESKDKSTIVINNPSQKLVAFVEKCLANKEKRRQHYIKNQHLYFPK